MNPRYLSAAALLYALAAAGCASARPEIRCTLKHEAEVYQGILGIGVGQRLAEADPLCTPPVTTP